MREAAGEHIHSRWVIGFLVLANGIGDRVQC